MLHLSESTTPNSSGQFGEDMKKGNKKRQKTQLTTIQVFFHLQTFFSFVTGWSFRSCGFPCSKSDFPDFSILDKLKLHCGHFHMENPREMEKVLVLAEARTQHLGELW